MIDKGFGERPCIRSSSGAIWTYADLRGRADRIAAILVTEYGLRPGNRVLLRAANTPMLAAAWFAVLKAGGIVVTTMPLLRSRELAYIVEKAKVSLAICDKTLAKSWKQRVDRRRICAPSSISTRPTRQAWKRGWKRIPGDSKMSSRPTTMWH